jgi:drug/metabolite transporter (DMT)-like permease
MSPIVSGALFAIASALAFGATAPLIGHFGAHLGPWTTAALLYIGAALATRPSIQPASRERGITPAALRRIAVCGILGAMLAPAALAWGIAHTGALSASLALSMESAFTIAIAAVVFREHTGARIIVAAALITLGAVVLLTVHGGGQAAAAGVAAVLVATLLWAIDNAITGTLSDTDPSAIVVVKSTIGVLASVAAALIAREPLPSAFSGVALIATGAVGYGVSLRWYLLAQRQFGVARTASLFAIAPFFGAALAYAFGERTTSVPAFAFATALIAAGIALHLSERHAHRHRHANQQHEHAHSHEDAHHDHVHAEPPAGPHSHEHVHTARTHEHPHAPDEHHSHTHDDSTHEHPGGQAFPTQKPS